jgi:hypothetical protein
VDFYACCLFAQPLVESNLAHATLRDQDAEANSLSEWLKDLNRALREKDAEIANKTELINRCNFDLELLRKEIEHWASAQSEPPAAAEVCDSSVSGLSMLF